MANTFRDTIDRPEDLAGLEGEPYLEELYFQGSPEPMWAAPLVDERAWGALAAHLDAEGRWMLQAHTLTLKNDAHGPQGAPLHLGGPPDSSVAYAFYEKDPVTVAGAIGDGPDPRAAAYAMYFLDRGSNAQTPLGWRRVHLSPAPTELSSVAMTAAHGHTWIAGRVDAAPVVYERLDLPFRGPFLRSVSVPMPALVLADEVVDGPGRPLVLVDNIRGDSPVFLAATQAGNRLCWQDGTTWKAHPAPDGRLHAASVAGGRVHVLIDGAVWSLEDPTDG
jgi:hypothetical protein